MNEFDEPSNFKLEGEKIPKNITETIKDLESARDHFSNFEAETCLIELNVFTYIYLFIYLFSLILVTSGVIPVLSLLFGTPVWMICLNAILRNFQETGGIKMEDQKNKLIEFVQGCHFFIGFFIFTYLVSFMLAILNVIPVMTVVILLPCIIACVYGTLRICWAIEKILK